MNPDLLLVLLLLGAAILMFAVNRPRVDAVALIAMVVLPCTGVITANETISGFATPIIVLIGAMFVIGEALARTGVARRVGDWLATRGGDRPGRQLAILMLTVGLLGSVMSSTGVVAMFIPVVTPAVAVAMVQEQLANLLKFVIAPGTFAGARETSLILNGLLAVDCTSSVPLRASRSHPVSLLLSISHW